MILEIAVILSIIEYSVCNCSVVCGQVCDQVFACCHLVLLSLYLYLWTNGP